MQNLNIPRKVEIKDDETSALLQTELHFVVKRNLDQLICYFADYIRKRQEKRGADMNMGTRRTDKKGI